MVKAIIVDDEQITREGLIEFVEWDKLGVEIAGEAADGIEAIELANNVHPDIILCDVRMPRMDGITMARHMREMFPKCKIIFLSGYSDVEYLKSAIKIKAVDYIEKPVDLEEFEKLISRTVLLCNEEKNRESMEQEMKLKVERSIPYHKSKLVENLVSSEEINIELIEDNLGFIGADFPLEDNFLCCVLKFHDSCKIDRVLDFIDSIIGKHGLRFLSANVNSEIVIVFSVKKDGSSGAVRTCCREIVKYVNANFRVNLTIGVGSPACCIDEVRISYIDAL